MFFFLSFIAVERMLHFSQEGHLWEATNTKPGECLRYVVANESDKSSEPISVLLVTSCLMSRRVFFTPKKTEYAVIIRRPTGGVQTQWKTPHTLKIHVQNGTVIIMIEGFMNNLSQRTSLNGTDSWINFLPRKLDHNFLFSSRFYGTK